MLSPRTPPRLLAITPASLPLERLIQLLPPLSEWVDAIHLRWPSLPTRECYERALALKAVSPRPLLLLNDRFDLVQAAGLDGVHLRDDGIAPTDLPVEARPRLVGVSRHDLPGVRVSGGADYVTVSPLRPTPSKPGARVLGESGLKEMCEASAIAVLGLGGVEPEDLPWILGAGAWGVAVLRGILGADDPVARARAYRDALVRARASEAGA